MKGPKIQDYRDAAAAIHHATGSVTVSHFADVMPMTEGGAWVQGWFFISEAEATVQQQIREAMEADAETAETQNRSA